MFRFLVIFFWIQAIAIAEVNLDKEMDALLTIHQQARQAHFQTDADLLSASLSEFVYSVDNGKVNRSTKQETENFFRSYFAGAEYSEWDDLEPPVVHVSKDASMAWMIQRVRVRRTQKDSKGNLMEQVFICAWMSAYEKQEGKWKLVATASTFETESH